ncbi:helix-turn-helix domain-containing protein [Pseudosulfitobacter pseudonitzschiae]|uniref:helix-turn-helix domain-containing protein n=1 Tax=Pseudosulfitobacter pseudonitzschiae TaxID=1402135 RepID=UPI001AFCBDA2|nr:helix-turn-helix transcriptional regulator [Pseudosulfitobacter pseudonitzschiae]MBM1813434.1 helix-turn-helix transcriptional regulator [Pseudosulfitobacter pseudonitzschiae]MBM1830427.1 helix-turn-helix transcriptional regulator [Pseudosulfitobacter pseudonitzschiae]MBM1835294.1 helix-turn-helix transcriptional regulator [Pseudosulfitobacter pseudonitzschiae]MBM1840140.1 helix-turn-helix transcriptional regulator [Pseudosulfitobacter pseudonitzschiae]MBM1845872.1 helix-turn-helix transcri
MTTLDQFLKETQQTQRDFARAVGVSASYMNEIVKGGKSPSLSIAAKIEAHTQGRVPMSALLPPTSDAA